MYSALCNHQHNQFKNIFITPKENLCSLAATPPRPTTLARGNHYLFSVSMGLSVLDSSNKWSYIICDLLWWKLIFLSFPGGEIIGA